MDSKLLQKERKEIFEAVYDGLIPKRVPIDAGLPIEFTIEYAGLPLASTQWTMEGMEEAYDKVLSMTSSDAYPTSFLKYPAHLQILGSKAFVMGSNGVIQHPEVSALQESDYEDFIQNPHDCVMEKVLPKLYPELDTDPVNRSLVMAKAFKAFCDYAETSRRLDAKFINKYGFYTPPPGSGAAISAPFDFLSDFLRGFKGISMDIKRCPEKVAAACEAAVPLTLKKGLPSAPSRYGATFIPLHMAPYLRTKDFEKLYWPTLSKVVWALAEAGQPCTLFCEQDWMRYLDYLYELPENTRLWFEYGDPKLVKEKLGKKHILSGFYPLTYLKTATKQECIDKAKELIDILAPGGKYIFRFDKNPLSLHDVNVENYAAVLKYIAENAYYPNAGQPTAPQSSAGAAPGAVTGSPSIDLSQFKSKYYKTWDEYKALRPLALPELEPVIAPKMQSYEEMMMGFISRLV